MEDVCVCDKGPPSKKDSVRPGGNARLRADGELSALLAILSPAAARGVVLAPLEPFRNCHTLPKTRGPALRPPTPPDETQRSPQIRSSVQPRPAAGLLPTGSCISLFNMRT